MPVRRRAKATYESRNRDLEDHDLEVDHMDRDDEPTNSMTAENVEQFDVWIFDSSELVVSVIPIDAPWNAQAESYALTEQA